MSVGSSRLLLSTLHSCFKALSSRSPPEARLQHHEKAFFRSDQNGCWDNMLELKSLFYS